MGNLIFRVRFHLLFPQKLSGDPALTLFLAEDFPRPSILAKVFPVPPEYFQLLLACLKIDFPSGFERIFPEKGNSSASRGIKFQRSPLEGENRRGGRRSFRKESLPVVLDANPMRDRMFADDRAGTGKTDGMRGQRHRAL